MDVLHWVPAILSIVALLSLSIAYGIADVSPPLLYAGLIGALGAFMTSSSTASNVLFGAGFLISRSPRVHRVMAGHRPNQQTSQAWSSPYDSLKHYFTEGVLTAEDTRSGHA